MNSISIIIKKLEDFWSQHGCIIIPPMNYFAGAATFHPQCILGVLNKTPERIMYTAQGVRHDDRTYGTNSHRLLQHLQFQVVLKNPPKDVLSLYEESLRAIGLDLNNNILQYLDSSWETKSFGAFGKGLEVSFNAVEITQYTYFEKVCDIDLKIAPLEITYGVERLAICLWPDTNLFDIPWSNDTTYGEIRLYEEHHRGYLNDTITPEDRIPQLLKNAELMLEKNYYMSAFYMLIESNDVFNCLDASARLSYIQRHKYTQKIRHLVNIMANQYVSDINTSQVL